MKEVRMLDIVLISATGLKKVNKSKMAAYVVAWIEPTVRVPGPKSNGTNPVWNSTISIAIGDRTFNNGMNLNLELLGVGILSTKPIGSVCVDIGDILSEGSKGVAAKAQYHDYPVMRRSGRLHGIVSFEIHLQESPSLLKVHDMIPTTLPSKEFSPETQPQSQPQRQGLGSYQQASWKASAKTAGQENQQSSAPTAVSNYPVPRNRVYAFQSPNPKTESKSLLSSFS